MKILVISPKNKTVCNFRGDLIKDMIEAGNQVVVTGPNKDFIDDIYSLGVLTFIEIPFVKDNASISGDISYLKRLKRVIKNEKPDIVFSYTIKPVIYGSLAAKAAGVKKVFAMVTGLGRVYASNGLKARLIRALIKRLYKKAFKACTSVIFQNVDDLNLLVNNKCLPFKKARLVNGSGVNMNRFKATELPNNISFLMVSRIIKEKGVNEFCEAARIIKKAHSNVKFVLLGGFDRSIGAIKPDDIKHFIEDGTIVFPGETKDPVSFYQHSYVFVLPSYYREGLPRTILEAMSCGRPVITTDWPGCREPIKDGINGFLVPIKNQEALAEKMLFFINNPDSLKSFSKESYKTCLEKYEVKVVNKQMKDIIGY